MRYVPGFGLICNKKDFSKLPKDGKDDDMR